MRDFGESTMDGWGSLRDNRRMRSPGEVARRALCLELLTQRFMIEAQASELGAAQAQEFVDGLGLAVAEAELDPVITESEQDHLLRAVGALDVADSWWDAHFADLAVLLYALGRVPELPTVARISSHMQEFLARGFLAASDGDMEACVKLLDAAELRPEEELVATLERAVEENEPFIANETVPGRDLPPATVLYVLPWLLDPAWPWGRPGKRLELAAASSSPLARSRPSCD